MWELPEQRQLAAKVYDLGNGRHQLWSEGIMHVPSDYDAMRRGMPVGFDDIDHNWIPEGDGWRLRNGWFTVTFDADKFGINVEWINSSVETWRLAKLDNTIWSRKAGMTTSVAGDRLTFHNVALDLDIVVEAKRRPHDIGFEIFKVIKSPDASHDLGWDVTWHHVAGEVHRKQFISAGHDAFRRPLIISHTVTDESSRPGGQRGRLSREQVTGFIRLAPPGAVTPKGRLVEPATILYPLTVDSESVHTSGTTVAKPVDWNDADNFIRILGAGGGAGNSSNANNTGGGGAGAGGAYSHLANHTWVTDPEAISLGTAGAAGTSGGNGTAGGDTNYRNASTLLAKGGGGGTGTTTSTGGAGGTGGAAASGVGDVKRSGGNGGTGGNGVASGDAGGGGGGGGGPAGDVGAGVAGTVGQNGDVVATEQGGHGGAGGDGNTGDANRGTGGAGGTAGSTVAARNGAVGTAGTDIATTDGTGGGGGGGAGGGSIGSAPAETGGNGAAGANYGAGGGANGGTGDGGGVSTSAAGTQGLLVLEWTPAVGGSSTPNINMQPRLPA